MRIKHITVENFRGLESVSFTNDTSAAVIVGPNAMGKTTIIEAIRMVKALLMPSYSTEAQEVLQSLGARSQHTQSIYLNSIMRDLKKMTRVELVIDLSEDEINFIGENIDALATKRLRARLGGNLGNEDLSLIQYMSSPQGRKTFDQLKELEIIPELEEVKRSKQIKPCLTIQNRAGGIRGSKAIDQEIISLLDETKLPDESLFSYFPADRAMPSGEVNIQIGSADAAQQLKTHIGNPGSKYTRLKQYIVNQFMRGDIEREKLKEDFSLIFENLLPGKKLNSLSVGRSGALQVKIEETKTGATYDIDSMSSGEKGLILTFFLMKRNTAPGGIILIDEPELHLNPAVCKKILPFLLNHILIPEGKQAIICTHSAEILAYAFEHGDCSLLHLRSSKDISPILKKDKEEVFEALKRLGTEQGDVLFSKGTLFVEGPDDVDLIEIGFSEIVSGFKVKALGGRSEVEKEIKVLQNNEKAGQLDSRYAFVFDRDRTISDLISSQNVKVKQWEQYCIENYLLDIEIVFDVMKDHLKDPKNLPSRGAFNSEVKETALKILKKRIAFDEFNRMKPQIASLKKNELLKAEEYADLAALCWDKIEPSVQGFCQLTPEAWKKDFEERCTKVFSDNKEKWESNWAKEVNGKELFNHLFQSYQFKISCADLKLKIIEKMRIEKRDSWTVIKGILNDLLN